MLRYHICLFSKIVPEAKVFCSTTVSSNRNRKPTTLIQKLTDEFSDITPIAVTLKKDEVRNIHFNEWKSRINLMKKFHFSNKECFTMISEYPLLLKIPFEKFESTLEQWFCADLGLQNFQAILLNQPILLEIDKEQIKIRVPKLRTHFRSSTALAQLLFTSPNVMFDSWQHVLSKLNYLIKDRGFKMGEISQSCALSKSLDFIKFRLDLLEKCGIYKYETQPIHKINKYDKSKHKNPELRDILLTRTNDFVKMARITPEEYATCKDLFMTNESEDSFYDDKDEGSGGYNKNHKKN